MCECNPIPKNKRIKDPKLIEEMREEIECCEICGTFSYGAFTLEMAHIVAKGLGGAHGPDMRENVVKACGPASLGLGCHGAQHKGIISRERFWQAAAQREKVTVDECKRRVRRAMGYNV